MDQEDIML